MTVESIEQGRCIPPRPNIYEDQVLIAAAEEDGPNEAAAAGTIALRAPKPPAGGTTVPAICLAYNLRTAYRPKMLPGDRGSAARYGIKRYAALVRMGDVGAPRVFVKSAGVRELLQHWRCGVAGVAARNVLEIEDPADAPQRIRSSLQTTRSAWAGGFRSAWQRMYSNTMHAGH